MDNPAGDYITEHKVPGNKTYVLTLENLATAQTQTASTTEHCLTAEELKALLNVGATCQLYERLPNGKRSAINPNQKVCFKEDKENYFYCIPTSNIEGRGNLILPEKDRLYLEEQGFNWEAISQNNEQVLIIHGYKLPNGYSQPEVDLAILIPAGYPNSQLDMFYCKPGISHSSGKPIGALTNFTILGQTWQRWSRHRGNGQDTWKPGMDCIFTHLARVEHWLKQAAL